MIGVKPYHKLEVLMRELEKIKMNFQSDDLFVTVDLGKIGFSPIEFVQVREAIDESGTMRKVVNFVGAAMVEHRDAELANNYKEEMN